MKGIIKGVGMIVFAGAVVAGGTGAFFSDTETSTANVFTAGAIDLKVDSVAHINGLVCFGGEWTPETIVEWVPEQGENEGFLRLNPENVDVEAAIVVYNTANPANVPQAGTACEGTWALTDLGPTHTFFDYGDLKPGDNGENTISLHVVNNDAYMCAYVHNVESADNTQTEPEAAVDTDGLTSGELDEELSFFIWEDDGDNIFEDNEPVLASNEDGVDIAGTYPLYTPQTTAIQALETTYVGVYWCYGDLTVTGTTLSCDGESVTNLSQTDSLKADISFYIEQARNNEGFTCPTAIPLEETGEEEDRQTVGANFSDYIAPVCTVTVTGDGSIQTAVNAAAVDSTVCVDPAYSGNGDNTAIRIETAGLTLAATVPGVSLDVPVVLSNSNVTVKGFDGTIGQAESPAEVAAFYLDNDASSADISFNKVVGTGSGAGILTETGAVLTGSVISNNDLSGAVQGIYLNPHTGTIAIEYNDIHDNTVGIGNLNGALVQNNEFRHLALAQEAIGAGNGGNGDYDNSIVKFNNFLDDTRINTYTLVGDVMAENNFFGPNGGALQAPVDVDFTPQEGSAFPQN